MINLFVSIRARVIGFRRGSSEIPMTIEERPVTVQTFLAEDNETEETPMCNSGTIEVAAIKNNVPKIGRS